MWFLLSSYKLTQKKLKFIRQPIKIKAITVLIVISVFYDMYFKKKYSKLDNSEISTSILVKPSEQVRGAMLFRGI